MEIKKGQNVWVNLNRGIQETKIESVGRKYIILEYDKRIKFDKDTLRQIGGNGIAYTIILDIEKYNQDIYYRKLKNNIKKFDWNTLNNEELDKIAKILEL